MPVRILLDAMGSDAHPQPEIEAARAAAELWGEPIGLVGPGDRLGDALRARPAGRAPVEIVHAPDVVEMTDHAADSARGKPLSSMAVGMQAVKGGTADAFVTAGNTGAAMVTALFRLGRIRGVKRPALCALFPVRDGRAVVLDIGANADCRPEYLVQFAIMGSVYAEKVLGRPTPRVALLSNGEEPGKGNELVREAYPLLQATSLNFIGNVEPKEVYGGVADVVVTDGFAGNVFLKASEAVASFLVDLIRGEIRRSLPTLAGGWLARPAFRRVGRLLDPAEYGAIPLLGIDGMVWIGHGRSDSRALLNAVRAARQAVESRLLESLRDAIQEQLRSPAAASEA